MIISLQHIHITSKNKYTLSQWYQDNLGFKIIEDIEKLGEKGGPLYISSDNGKTAISIFNDDPHFENTKLNCIPAFCLPAEDFFKLYKKFLNCLSELDIVDHYLFISFYIHDSDNNRIEINCLEIKELKEILIFNKIKLTHYSS